MTTRTVALLSMCALFNAAACSGDDDARGGSGSADGGADAAAVDSGARVTDRGKVIDYDTKKGVADVVVTEGDSTTTTAADGTFAVTPLANTKVTLSFRKDKYTKLDWPEVILTGDRDRGNVGVVSLETFHLGSGALDGYDPALGIVYLSIKPAGSCTDTAGSSVEVLSPANATVRYAVKGLPRPAQTSTFPGEDPGVVVYNLQPGEAVTLAVTHPTCKQAPFPYTLGTATFTGNIVTAGGDGNTYAIVYME
jgi:hypothetical protein